VDITTSKSGPATILTLDGYLDSFSVNFLKETFNRLFEESIYNVIVDLSSVGFVDSAGLGQLVSALRMCIHHKGNVILVGVNESVVDLLRITKLDTIFKIYDNLEDAVESFNNS